MPTIKRISSLILILLLAQTISAQCFKKNEAFQAGEFVSFNISYNFGPIWMDAGTVTFSVTNENFHGKACYHLKATGKTFFSYDYFFKVRDYYDSWVDQQNFNTIEFRRSIVEGKYSLLNTIRYDTNRSKIISNTKRNNDPVTHDTIIPKPCTFDMLSAVYFTRTMDLTSMERDKKIPVNVVIDENLYDIFFKFLGKEIIETNDGQRYRCNKFSARMVQGTIFKGDEDVLVWITDDENKIPVLVEAKIIVGTVKACLKEVKGLRNPSGSLVK
ncbi:MAG: DUF3108 domain-containing protein [Bacteroidota bacterium]